jgi:hypothetical protein
LAGGLAQMGVLSVLGMILISAFSITQVLGTTAEKLIVEAKMSDIETVNKLEYAMNTLAQIRSSMHFTA